MAHTPGSLCRARIRVARTTTTTVLSLAVVTAASLGAGTPAAARASVRPAATPLTAFAHSGSVLGDSLLAQADAQSVAAERTADRAAREARLKAKAARKRAAERRARTKARHHRASRGDGRRGLGPTGWTTPVRHIAFSAQYGQPGSWSSGYHTGVDFVVPVGTPVRAVGAGTVVTAGFDGAYGNNIVLRHQDGMYTHYAHLSSLHVSVGQPVSAGQQLGLSGATGNVTGPHLHFEARRGPGYGSDTNPLAYLRRHGVRI